MKVEKVSVFGLGYIGLPTAAVLASKGCHVTGVDVNHNVVETINSGRIHIVEPDLDGLVSASVWEGSLRAVTNPVSADAHLIAVPTPFKTGYRPDLSYIESACKMLAPVLKQGDLVVLESTSPVGATEQLCCWLADARKDLTFPHTAGSGSDIRVAHCPERVLPGRVLCELVENDRIIGGITERCAEAACAVYEVFVTGDLICTDVRTAEMCKLTENAFRDVNIALANELSMVCDSLSINVWELIRLANRHPRVNILQPGPGVGGHCIAVDPWFIISQNPEQTRLMRSAREINDYKPGYVVSKILERVSEKEHSVIACLGLAFKPNVDDLRESPALTVVKKLASNKNLTVLSVEPHINELPRDLSAFGNVELVTLDESLQRADFVVGLVKHDLFMPTLSDLDLKSGWFLDFVDMGKN